MQDIVLSNTGNSRLLKTTSDATYADFAAFLTALKGSGVPVDVAWSGSGVTTQGTALNTANLLSSDTASAIQTATGSLAIPETPNEAFSQLANAIGNSGGFKILYSGRHAGSNEGFWEITTNLSTSNLPDYLFICGNVPITINRSNQKTWSLMIPPIIIPIEANSNYNNHYYFPDDFGEPYYSCHGVASFGFYMQDMGGSTHVNNGFQIFSGRTACFYDSGSTNNLKFTVSSRPYGIFHTGSYAFDATSALAYNYTFNSLRYYKYYFLKGPTINENN